jgi:hypothetical protein
MCGEVPLRSVSGFLLAGKCDDMLAPGGKGRCWLPVRVWITVGLLLFLVGITGACLAISVRNETATAIRADYLLLSAFFSVVIWLWGGFSQ